MPFSFDITNVPFSRSGSYMCIKADPDKKNLLSLRTIHGEASYHGAAKQQAFTIELRAGGRVVPFSIKATPAEVVLTARQGRARFCFARPDTLRFRAKGVTVRLTMDESLKAIVLPDRDNWVVNSFGNKRQFYLRSRAGKLVMDAPWKGTAAGSKNWQAYTCGRVRADFIPSAPAGWAEGSVEMFKASWSARTERRTYAACAAAVKKEYAVWQRRLPAAPGYAKGRDLAGYINWSCTVAPDGHFSRPAMLMSKNWMNGVWSWDHVFNALGTVRTDPALAWDQYMLMFDCQDPRGALPDRVSDSGILWSFTKPPVHGWALRRMMERSRSINTARLKEVYAPLALWTEWWLACRDDDGDGLAGYNHGNDSGWDNATLFFAGPPLTGPDLAAFLIIQMDVLADVARQLGKKADARKWEKRADRMLKLMYAKLWDGERFVARSPRGVTPAEADSLISFVPLVLGKRLDTAIRKELVTGLSEKGRFLCPAGLASEAMTSPYFKEDGYWQGAAWASAAMLIIDGLADAGETALARKISRAFCRNACKNGMAENYSALTGRGLCDPAYTWTSSVFLTLIDGYV